jgi:MATE family multidrug resistance protein
VSARFPEVRSIAALAAPIVVTQVGSMMLGVVDMLMVSDLGREALAAAALGNLWLFGTIVVSMGVVLGIDPVVTQTHGAGDGRATGLALQRGLVIAALASVPTVLLVARHRAGAPAGRPVADPRASWPTTTCWSRRPASSRSSASPRVRSYLQGRGVTAPAMWITLVVNVLNVLFNWVLIHGHLGFPALGLVGAGIATGVSRSLMFVLLVLVVWRWRLHAGAWQPWSRAAFAAAGLLEILRLGVPVGLQLALEVWAFQAATLFAGWLGDAELAAHTIVLNLASLSFMIPLGISMATVTRVGNLLGARERRAAQHAAWVALAMGAGVMGLSAISFVLLRDVLPTFYADEDPAVLVLAATILPIAGAFQLFDGTQVVGGGILRGMGRTRPAAVFNLVGYYALGLPLSWYLAFETGMGLPGIWWGLTLGLAVVSALLLGWIAVRGPARMP